MARWTDFSWLFSRSSNYQFVQDLESADKDISHSLPISNKGEHATSPEDPLAAIAWKKVAYVALNATSTITITFLNRQYDFYPGHWRTNRHLHGLGFFETSSFAHVKHHLPYIISFAPF